LVAGAAQSVGPAKRSASMRFVEQVYRVLVRQRFEPFANQTHAHVDLVEARQSLKQLFERSCVPHGLDAPYG
jgi:hypothetical protein